MRKRRWLAAGAVLLAGSLGALGCGSDEQDAAAEASTTAAVSTSQPASTAPPVEPPPPPEPAEPAPPSPSDAPIATRFVMVTGDGSRIRTTLRVGELYRIGEEPPIAGLNVHFCSADPIRDAVIPIEQTIENLTEGFPIEAEFLVAPSNGPVSVEYVERGEAACWESPERGRQTQRFTTLEPGDSVTYPGFLIVREHYTPRTPNGNRELLCGTELTATRNAHIYPVRPAGAERVPLDPGGRCS